MNTDTIITLNLTDEEAQALRSALRIATRLAWNKERRASSEFTRSGFETKALQFERLSRRLA